MTRASQKANNLYVALLRGINIGGRNLMKMPKLQKSFESIGMQDVTTYINTGNIIFRAPKLSRATLVDKLQEVIRQDFSLDIKVLLRSFDEIQPLIEFVPDSWVNDPAMKCDVMFLWDDIDNSDIIAALTKGDAKVVSSKDGKISAKLLAQDNKEHLHHLSGAIIWKVQRDKVSKCHALQKLASHKLYKSMTVRNINTTRKIYSLMQNVL